MKEKILSTSQYLNFLTILASFVVFALAWPKLPPVVPLWYSRPWGEEQIVSKIYLGILPTCSLAVYLLNNLLIKLVAKNNRSFWEVFIRITSFVFSVLASFSLFKIILLTT